MWCKMCCYKYISDQRHSQIIWMNNVHWTWNIGKPAAHLSPSLVGGDYGCWQGQEGEGGRPPILLSPTRLSLKGLQTSKHLAPTYKILQTSSSCIHERLPQESPPDSSPNLQASKSTTSHTRLSMIGLQTSSLKVSRGNNILMAGSAVCYWVGIFRAITICVENKDFDCNHDLNQSQSFETLEQAIL